MDSIVLKKINNGDTGSVAAHKIYQNDQALREAVNTIQSYLDAYGDLVNLEADVESGGTVVRLSLEQGPGSGTTAVMSQNAVTEFVNDSVEDVCKIGEEIRTPIYVPETAEYVDAWVARASSNAEGHSLTVLYNDVQEMKEEIQGCLSYIQELRNELDNSNARIAQLESIVGV